MQIFWIILGLVIGGVIAYLVLSRKKGEKKDDIGLNLILTQLNELSRTGDKKKRAAPQQTPEKF